MKILLVNDDGFDAPGILAMRDSLERAGHEVFLCGPDGQRSGRSHAITIFTPLKVCRINDSTYSFEGTPADCVMLGTQGGIFPKVDAVVSGINSGFNLSGDMMYSGTDGAAADAADRGYRAIAISCDASGDEIYKGAADFVTDNLETLVDSCPKECFLNINWVPNAKGWKVTTPGLEEKYSNSVVWLDESTVELRGALKESQPEAKPGTDIAAVDEGHISISVVHIVPKEHEVFRRVFQDLDLRY